MILKNLKYFASGIENDIYMSKSTLTWFEAYKFSRENDWNLLVFKDNNLLLNFIHFVAKQKLRKSYWVLNRGLS